MNASDTSSGSFVTKPRRPVAVTVIGWLLVAAGVVGFSYHVTEFRALRPFPYDVLWVCLVRLLAVLGGAFLLRGHNWARWLVLAWMAYHVVLSALHSWSQTAIHALFLAVLAAFLLRPRASAYLRCKDAETPKTPQPAGDAR